MDRHYPKRTLLLLAIAIGCNQAVEAPSQTQSPNESSKPAAKAEPADFETGEDAIRALYTSFENEDLDLALRASHFSDKKYQEYYLKAQMVSPKAFRNFNAAMKDKFDLQEPLFPSITEPFLAKLDVIPVEYGDDTAIWQHQPNKALQLIKTESGWKVDFTAMEEQAPDKLIFKPMYEVGLKVRSITQQISADQYENAEHARLALVKLLKN